MLLRMPIPPLSRLVLVPTLKPAVAGGAPAPVRGRYRLARIHTPGRDGQDRFSHLKRSYD